MHNGALVSPVTLRVIAVIMGLPMLIAPSPWRTGMTQQIQIESATLAFLLPELSTPKLRTYVAQGLRV